jgi:cleavage and polyadenylation specificity factor subunit 3
MSEAGTKRKDPPETIIKQIDDDVLKIMPIGAGNEVGRSCILITFKGKHIMVRSLTFSRLRARLRSTQSALTKKQLDSGIHPAYTGLSSLPYFDMIDDPSAIDVLLVSHFHLDHCASLPYFTEKVSLSLCAVCVRVCVLSAV